MKNQGASCLLARNLIEKIISGGQTGADRAALDWALEHKVPHGGWCPKGRRAEDGTISGRYHLRETPSANSRQRTEWNVRDSDATIIFSISPNLRGGSQLTLEACIQYRKPVLRIWRQGTVAAAGEKVRRFVGQHAARTLNIAGPRRSESSQIGTFVREVLDCAFGRTR